MLNLLTDAWIPITRLKSGQHVIRPSQIAERLYDDPVVAIEWPRADFRIATLELMIGLLATACPPEDGDAWLAGWHQPPSPEQLDDLFAPFAHAFSLDGPGPRFLQDLEDLNSGFEPIERLLIEAPGDSTTAKNTDLMVHRNAVRALGRPAAAIALYTFQSWAPAGGAGNRTGLRGGGPLVTLVAPHKPQDLWHLIWANVPEHGSPADPQDLELVFPWLAPSITSEGNRVVTPENAHPLQCWWGMPRRIRLDFNVLDALRPCGLTGNFDSVEVTTWRQRPRGANYAGWGRAHSLTPHYKSKTSPEWLPVHPQPGGIGYRDWLGLVMRDPEGARMPAGTITTWRETRARDLDDAESSILAAGYDMDNMKARSFVESEMPLPLSASREEREAMDALATALVQSANQVANLLRGAVRDALFARGASVKVDAMPFLSARERLWEMTEGEFFTILEQVAAHGDRAETEPRPHWRKSLRDIAFALFDEVAPLAPDTGETEAVRIATARKFLGLALAGYGKAGLELFTTLGLPSPIRSPPKQTGGNHEP